MIISCHVDGGHKDITRSLDQALCSEEYDARYTSLESAPNESHFYIYLYCKFRTFICAIQQIGLDLKDFPPIKGGFWRRVFSLRLTYFAGI